MVKEKYFGHKIARRLKWLEDLDKEFKTRPSKTEAIYRTEWHVSFWRSARPICYTAHFRQDLPIPRPDRTDPNARSTQDYYLLSEDFRTAKTPIPKTNRDRCDPRSRSRHLHIVIVATQDQDRRTPVRGVKIPHRKCGKVTYQILGRGSVTTQLRCHLLVEYDAKGPSYPIRRWKAISTGIGDPIQLSPD